MIYKYFFNSLFQLMKNNAITLKDPFMLFVFQTVSSTYVIYVLCKASKKNTDFVLCLC